MLKKILISLGLLSVIALGGGIYVYQKLNLLAEHKLTVKPEQLFVLEKGTSSQKLAQLLAEQGIIHRDDVELLPYLIRLNPKLSKFKAGVYALDNIATVKELLQHFNSGKEVQLNVQFIEGKTFKTWREQLAKARYLEQTLTDKTEADI
ncbi:endolytic transglycosylase MltG, partial [Glaesserella parasuis]